MCIYNNPSNFMWNAISFDCADFYAHFDSNSKGCIPDLCKKV